MFINVQRRNYTMSKPFLFVGLDYENPSEVAGFAEELTQVDRTNFGFKLNLDFILNTALLGDRKPFERVLKLGRPIFADLKMWNGKRTMTSIAEGLIKTGIDYFNVYSLADAPFLKAVVEATNGTKTKVLGVTVLTHYDEDYCQRACPGHRWFEARQGSFGHCSFWRAGEWQDYFCAGLCSRPGY